MFSAQNQTFNHRIHPNMTTRVTTKPAFHRETKIPNINNKRGHLSLTNRKHCDHEKEWIETDLYLLCYFVLNWCGITYMGSRDNPPLDRILAEIQPSNKTFSKENGRSVEFEDCSARVFFSGPLSLSLDLYLASFSSTLTIDINKFGKGQN